MSLPDQKCPHCGAAYSTADYRSDAPVWLCSYCKGVVKGSQPFDAPHNRMAPIKKQRNLRFHVVSLGAFILAIALAVTAVLLFRPFKWPWIELTHDIGPYHPGLWMNDVDTIAIHNLPLSISIPKTSIDDFRVLLISLNSLEPSHQTESRIIKHIGSYSFGLYVSAGTQNQPVMGT